MNRALLVLCRLVGVLSVAVIGYAVWRMRRPPTPILAEEAPRSRQRTTVDVTTNGLSLDGKQVVTLDSLELQQTRGIDPRWTVHGRGDLAIVPLIEALKLARSGRPGEAALSIRLDPRVP